MKTQTGLHVQALDIVAASRCAPLAHAVDFSLRPGDRLGVIGRNGAGKSTLLRQIAGLLPLAGMGACVALDGQPLHALQAERLARLRAFMPAQPRDRFSLPVAALLELSQPRPDATAARDVLQRVDAWELRDRDVLALSAGERQRVALAQALAQDCPLLLLDEPVAFQDPGHQALVGAVLRQLNDRIVVFCGHDVNWVAQQATHVLGLGLLGQEQAWFFAPGETAWQVQRLQQVYGCGWSQLHDAHGHRAWFAA
jgi:iron complex transport system ATP-binding protein